MEDREGQHTGDDSFLERFFNFQGLEEYESFHAAGLIMIYIGTISEKKRILLFVGAIWFVIGIILTPPGGVIFNYRRNFTVVKSIILVIIFLLFYYFLDFFADL